MQPLVEYAGWVIQVFCWCNQCHMGLMCLLPAVSKCRRQEHLRTWHPEYAKVVQVDSRLWQMSMRFIADGS